MSDGRDPEDAPESKLVVKAILIVLALCWFVLTIGLGDELKGLAFFQGFRRGPFFLLAVLLYIPLSYVFSSAYREKVHERWRSAPRSTVFAELVVGLFCVAAGGFGAVWLVYGLLQLGAHVLPEPADRPFAAAAAAVRECFKSLLERRT